MEEKKNDSGKVVLPKLEVFFSRQSTNNPGSPSFTIRGLEKVLSDYDTDDSVMDGVKLIVASYIEVAVKNKLFVSPSTIEVLTFHINSFLNEKIESGSIRVKKDQSK